jgi:hypothetical protein
MLGNWVLAGKNAKFPMRVVGVFDDVAYLDFEGNESDMWEEEEEDMFPIPLTEEILLKNGFINMSDYYKDKEGNIFVRLGDDITTSIRVECLNRELNKPTCSKVSAFNKTNYVHELQNLLTLAGVEMEFKI